eukprot:6332381-Pyramimonas_sp.AAC.1
MYSERDALVGGLARHVGIGDIVGDGAEKPIGIALLRLGLKVQYYAKIGELVFRNAVSKGVPICNDFSSL